MMCTFFVVIVDPSNPTQCLGFKPVFVDVFSVLVFEKSKINGQCNQFPCSQPTDASEAAFFASGTLSLRCTGWPPTLWFLWLVPCGILISSGLNLRQSNPCWTFWVKKVKQKVKSRWKLREKERGNTKNKKEQRRSSSDCLRFPVGKSHIWTIFLSVKVYIICSVLAGARRDCSWSWRAESTAWAWRPLWRPWGRQTGHGRRRLRGVFWFQRKVAKV